MTRRRAAHAVAVTALLAGVVGLLATYSGLLVLRPLDEPLATWAVVWVLLAVAAVLYRPAWRRVAIAALPVLAAVYLTGFGALMHDFGAFDDTRVLRHVRVGGRDVLLVEGSVLIDPAWEVRVRTRRGPLSREWVAWWRTDGTPVVDMSVTGTHEVELVDGTGQRYLVSV